MTELHINTLCCKNLVNKGSGATSFRYVNDGSLLQGHVSVNSTKTLFQNGVKMGFNDQCFLKTIVTYQTTKYAYSKYATLQHAE
jgi:hypothetical protein